MQIILCMQKIAPAGESGSHEFHKELHRVIEGHAKYTFDKNDDNIHNENHDEDNHDDTCIVQETQM